MSSKENSFQSISCYISAAETCFMLPWLTCQQIRPLKGTSPYCAHLAHMPCVMYRSNSSNMCMRAFFAQQDHMQVFHFTVDCLDVMGKQRHLWFLPFCGTSDQPLADWQKLVKSFFFFFFDWWCMHGAGDNGVGSTECSAQECGSALQHSASFPSNASLVHLAGNAPGQSHSKAGAASMCTGRSILCALWSIYCVCVLFSQPCVHRSGRLLRRLAAYALPNCKAGGQRGNANKMT